MEQSTPTPPHPPPPANASVAAAAILEEEDEDGALQVFDVEEAGGVEFASRVHMHMLASMCAGMCACTCVLVLCESIYTCPDNSACALYGAFCTRGSAHL